MELVEVHGAATDDRVKLQAFLTFEVQEISRDHTDNPVGDGEIVRDARSLGVVLCAVRGGEVLAFVSTERISHWRRAVFVMKDKRKLRRERHLCVRLALVSAFGGDKLAECADVKRRTNRIFGCGFSRHPMIAAQ